MPRGGRKCAGIATEMRDAMSRKLAAGAVNPEEDAMSVNDATGMWVDDGLSEMRAAEARKEALEARLSALRQGGGVSAGGRGGRGEDETDYDRIWKIARRGQEVQRMQNKNAALINLVRRRNRLAVRRLNFVAGQLGGLAELLGLLEKRIAASVGGGGAARDSQLLRRVAEGLLETYVRLRVALPDFAPPSEAERRVVDRLRAEADPLGGDIVGRYKAAMRDEIREELRRQ